MTVSDTSPLVAFNIAVLQRIRWDCKHTAAVTRSQPCSWAYIKEKNLQDPQKKSIITLDETLKEASAFPHESHQVLLQLWAT